MAKLDRPAVIDLLGRLGAQGDEAALQAARDLHRTVAESGMTWDDLLRTDFETADAAPDIPIEDVPEERGDGPTDKADSARLIDRLLTRKTISSALRDDLTQMKQNIADGSFDDMDARYVRALARRLGA
jgi:hypothetical protein